MFSCFATAAKGLGELLAAELERLGASAIKPQRAGVAFNASLAAAYRACLWSRLASRILLTLTRFPAPDPRALYDGVRMIDWNEHLAHSGTLAVDFTTSRSAITHTQFGAQKVKDAIVDQFRERLGARPSVDLERPSVRINVYVDRDQAAVSIDLAGQGLHRRGYRSEHVKAPLKENLAAAILLRAGWPALAAAGKPLLDPMCGSGTLPIEAALMAGDIAPGLARDYFGFLGWRQHDEAQWAELIEEGRARKQQGLRNLPRLWGFDHDARAIMVARSNAARAGLADYIEFQQRAFTDSMAPSESDGGLVVVNPPYGERVGETASLPAVYRALGATLKQRFPRWRAAVFTGNPDCGRYLGLSAHKVHKLFNGALPCELMHFELHATAARQDVTTPKTGGATMLRNRLRKNLKHLQRWAARENIGCYRLYDADLPEYNFALDVYRNGQVFVHLQEYEAPSTIDPRRAQSRLNEALAMAPELLAAPPEHVFLKRRQRQRGGAQYEKLAARGQYHAVREGSYKFWVNFTDYLDTGLFLDQRKTRAALGQVAAGRGFLNLFAYTGTATVAAAVGGATATTSVDMSRTYLAWAARNLKLNGIADKRHELVRAEVLAWLSANQMRRYGLIFVDPPSFSRSKRMTGTFDVQRDHVRLIHAAVGLLEPDGVLIFSTHLRRFKLDAAALTDLAVEEISRQMQPRDFARHRPHRCYRLRRRGM